MSESSTFQMAERYLSHGYSVLPIKQGSKQPAVWRWQQLQVTPVSLEKAARWWATGEDGIGIVTGAVSGIVVLDIDGEIGLSEVLRLGIGAGAPTVKTPRGQHVYLRHPGMVCPNRAGLLSQLDLRGDGGYVVAPPTTGYTWVRSPWEIEPPRFPQWLIDLTLGSQEGLL